MGRIENKACINATICLIGIQTPTVATHYLPPDLAFAVGIFVFHVAVLAGILAVAWPLYGTAKDLYQNGQPESTPRNLT